MPTPTELLTLLPHRGDFGSAFAASQFREKEQSRFADTRFTGVSHILWEGRPIGALLFNMGQFFRGVLDGSGTADGDPAEMLTQVPSGSVLHSVRLSRQALRLGAALCRGIPAATWSQPQPLEQAVALLDDVGVGGLVWAGSHRQLSIYQNRVLMPDSPPPNPNLPGPLLLYRAPRDLPKPPPVASPHTPPPVELPGPAAPAFDLDLAWRVAEEMYVKRLGRSGSGAVQALRSKIILLPAPEQLEALEATLAQAFGPNAVPYFEKRLRGNP